MDTVVKTMFQQKSTDRSLSATAKSFKDKLTAFTSGIMNPYYLQEMSLSHIRTGILCWIMVQYTWWLYSRPISGNICEGYWSLRGLCLEKVFGQKDQDNQSRTRCRGQSHLDHKARRSVLPSKILYSTTSNASLKTFSVESWKWKRWWKRLTRSFETFD